MFLFMLTLFIFSKDGRVTAGFKGSTRASLNLSGGTQDKLAHLHNYHDVGLSGQKDSMFTLRVQVKTAASQEPLSHAFVEVFANYTLINSTRTGRDGVTVLRVPYTYNQPLMLVARKDGYIQTPLLWKTARIPIFSSVTLQLPYQNQGNIWLFEDLVIITGKMSDMLPPANVQFPKRLLPVPDSSISSLTAYLTVPRLSAEKYFFFNTTGIDISKSGYRSVELNPIAAVSVQLLNNGKNVKISGPVQITLPLADSSQSQLSYAVPAWLFDRKTGAWVNHGLGTIQMENRHLVWVYTAPHLDYWIAAPFPSSTGYMGHESVRDFLSHNASLLVPVVGGGLVITTGLLAVVSCYCSDSLCKRKRKRGNGRKSAARKKEQPNGRNNNNEQIEISFKPPTRHRDGHPSALSQSTSVYKRSQVEMKKKLNSSMRKTGKAEIQIYEDITNNAQHSLKTIQTPQNVYSELVIPVSLHENENLPQNLVLYNQHATLIQHITSLDEASGSRAATLPQKAVQYRNLEKPVHKQASPKNVEQQDLTMETPYGEPRSRGWNCMLESVSVPETLNKATGLDTSCGTHQGTSERTLHELTKSRPFPHPKAWFVSLEGKPLAQVCHSILDLRKCHLLTDSHDLSLDSGVDLNKQHRKQSCLKRRSTALIQPICSEDADLSNCESGRIITCTADKLGTMSYLPEEKCDIIQGQRMSTKPSRTKVQEDKGKAKKHLPSKGGKTMYEAQLKACC